MSRLVSKPRSTRKAKEHLPLDMISSIYKQEYVLILGSAVTLNPKKTKTPDSKVFVEKEFAAEYTSTEIDDKKTRLADFLNNPKKWKYKLDETSDALKSLIRTGFFRVVLTTAYDGYIETIMRDYWEKTKGEKLRVLNIWNTEDCQSKIDGDSEFSEIQPTLFYVFGKAMMNPNNKRSLPQYVLSEKDYIKVIQRWLDIKTSPGPLIAYLKTKNLLAIGCHFDDWLFRFFWYSLRQNKEGENGEEDLSGDVAIGLDPEKSESDKKLAMFMQGNNIKEMGVSPIEFIKTLSKDIESPEMIIYLGKYLGRLKAGGIFLSYAHEDFYIVLQIFDWLVENRYNVWFDNRNLNGGDNYDPRINSAISQCKTFIPILSKHTIKDIDSAKNRYYMKEWDLIKDNVAARIVPVTLSGFNIANDREKLPEILRDKTIVDWSNNGKARLLESVKD